jgi:uncharacterized protein (TIGR02246 family)
MHMKGLVGVMLLTCACAGPVWAGAFEARSQDSNMADFFKQLEQDWEDAVQARDVDKVAEIEADDLRSVGFAGSVDTKQDDLSGLKSGKGKHLSLELGPVEVKMLSDDIAVVQSSATERSAAGTDNTDPARAFAFMDVFVKRGGRWMVVRSLAAKVN